jgi:hypothetical protein
MGNADLDVDVRLVQGAEIVEEAQIRVLDPRDDLLKHILSGEVVA